jgi:hypothetical protein
VPVERLTQRRAGIGFDISSRSIHDGAHTSVKAFATIKLRITKGNSLRTIYISGDCQVRRIRKRAGQTAAAAAARKRPRPAKAPLTAPKKLYTVAII